MMKRGNYFLLLVVLVAAFIIVAAYITFNDQPGFSPRLRTSVQIDIAEPVFVGEQDSETQQLLARAERFVPIGEVDNTIWTDSTGAHGLSSRKFEVYDGGGLYLGQAEAKCTTSCSTTGCSKCEMTSLCEPSPAPGGRGILCNGGNCDRQCGIGQVCAKSCTSTPQMTAKLTTFVSAEGMDKIIY